MSPAQYRAVPRNPQPVLARRRDHHRAQDREPGDEVRERLPQPAGARRVVRVAASTLRRAQPDRSQAAGDDGQPGERQPERDVLAGGDHRDRGAQRGGREDRVLESAEREDSRHRAVAVLAGAAQRPVVDREAAVRSRRGEDAEAADDRLDRVAEAQLRAVVDLGRVAHREHVAGVGDRLAEEAEHEPGGVEVPRRPVEPVRARDVGEPGDRREREHRRDEQHEQRAALEPAERAPKRTLARRGGGLRHAGTLAAPAQPHSQAAGVGFEPTGALSGASGFQDRPIRPLWHPAVVLS